MVEVFDWHYSAPKQDRCSFEGRCRGFAALSWYRLAPNLPDVQRHFSFTNRGCGAVLLYFFDSRSCRAESRSTPAAKLSPYTAVPIVHSAPSSAMRIEERRYKNPPPPPSHGLLSLLLSSSLANTIHNTQYTLEIYRNLSLSILQNTMQFYLLLVLSGVISGSTVLAQTVTGYSAAGCSGDTIFTYTATCTSQCVELDNPGTLSVDLPQGVQCVLFMRPGCDEPSQPFINPGCNTVTISGVRSYFCLADEGC